MGEIAAPPAPAAPRFALAGSARAAALMLTGTVLFAAMALADAAVTFADQPQYLGIGVNVVALAAAVIFTLRYPAAARR